jgi:hypothetical protein
MQRTLRHPQDLAYVIPAKEASEASIRERIGLVMAQWFAWVVSSSVLNSELINRCSTSGSEAMWALIRLTVGFSCKKEGESDRRKEWMVHRRSEEVMQIISLGAECERTSTDLILVEEHIRRDVVHCSGAQGTYRSI